MEALEDAGEDSKCGIVHQLLCMACLGPRQTLHILKDEALKLYNMTVNSGQQLIHNVSPRVCWECEILLKKVIHFREKVTECYDILNSPHVMWSEVTCPSRLQMFTTAQIDIPPLDPEYSMLEVKQEIVEVEYHEPSESEDTQPCMACLCGGCHLNNIRDKELKYYTDILNQKMQGERDVSTLSPLLCWECCFMLGQATRLWEQSVEAYQTLLPSLQTANIQDITSLLCSEVSLPPRLRICVRDRVDIPPHAYTHNPLPPVKLEPGSLGYGVSSTPPAEHVQRPDEPATEVRQTSSQTDTAHITTSNITCDRCHREFTLKQHLISHIAGNICLHNNVFDDSYVCVESAIKMQIDPRRERQSSQETSHASDKPYQCNECSKSFRYKSRLMEHKITHSTEKPYQCSQCLKAFTRKLCLAQHIRTHSGERPYKCSQCPKTYTRKENLVNHMITHTGVKPIQCYQCSEEFSLKQDLVDHMRTHTEDKTYQCSQCSKVYSRKQHLVDHMKTHSTENPYQCSQCTKSFALKRYLSQHIRTHTGEKPHQCSQCPKAFVRKLCLAQHMRTHSGERPYQCNQCSKAFIQKQHLVDHTKTHTKEKPYQCIQCSKAFCRKQNLVQHMTTHAGEMPYQCSQCSNTYTRKEFLVDHMKTHTKENRYHCTQCSKEFIQKQHLVDHMRTHTIEQPYQCRQCSKMYTRKQGLFRHIRTHSGERPYQCSQCSKAYIQKQHLVDHMRTHTKEKPFQCTMCSKMYSRKQYLAEHIKTQHTGEKSYECNV